MFGKTKQDLAAGHRNAEVAEMSALLCASILSRSLTPEQRREEKERVRRTHGQSSGGSATNGDSAEEREARTARMLVALDAAEEDLRSEAVPIRARGVVTLTRCVHSWSSNMSVASAAVSPFMYGGNPGGWMRQAQKIFVPGYYFQ